MVYLGALYNRSEILGPTAEQHMSAINRDYGLFGFTDWARPQDSESLCHNVRTAIMGFGRPRVAAGAVPV